MNPLASEVYKECVAALKDRAESASPVAAIALTSTTEFAGFEFLLLTKEQLSSLAKEFEDEVETYRDNYGLKSHRPWEIEVLGNVNEWANCEVLFRQSKLGDKLFDGLEKQVPDPYARYIADTAALPWSARKAYSKAVKDSDSSRSYRRNLRFIFRLFEQVLKRLEDDGELKAFGPRADYLLLPQLIGDVGYDGQHMSMIGVQRLNTGKVPEALTQDLISYYVEE